MDGWNPDAPVTEDKLAHNTHVIETMFSAVMGGVKKNGHQMRVLIIDAGRTSAFINAYVHSEGIDRRLVHVVAVNGQITGFGRMAAGEEHPDQMLRMRSSKYLRTLYDHPHAGMNQLDALWLDYCCCYAGNHTGVSPQEDMRRVWAYSLRQSPGEKVVALTLCSRGGAAGPTEVISDQQQVASAFGWRLKMCTFKLYANNNFMFTVLIHAEFKKPASPLPTPVSEQTTPTPLPPTPPSSLPPPPLGWRTEYVKPKTGMRVAYLFLSPRAWYCGTVGRNGGAARYGIEFDDGDVFENMKLDKHSHFSASCPPDDDHHAWCALV